MNDLKNEIRILLPALEEPRVITSPAPWAGHTPFALWFIHLHRPKIFVELGSYSGISYLAFCEAVRENNIDARCYAIDTWAGDAHAGFYGEHIYQTLRQNHDSDYSSFSTLVRKTFDEAVTDFEDCSIDLLHIDGLHTYDAVRHDFETWLPKLSDRAVVLFHDTEVRKGDFGVWRFWEEISLTYPGFAFQHSHGLGVLFVGSASAATMKACGIDLQSSENIKQFKRVFEALGRAQERRAQLHSVQHEWNETRLKLEQLSTKQEASESGRLQALRLLDQERSNFKQLLQAEHEAKTELQQSLMTQHRWIEKQDQLIKTRDQALELKSIQLVAMDLAYRQTLDQRLRRGVRSGMAQLRPSVIRRRAIQLAHRSRNALRYALRGDFSALAQRARGLWRERQLAGQLILAGGGSGRVGILSTPHTLFVAHAIEQALVRIGFTCHITLEDAPSDFALDFYIVLCAQMFRNLPPGEKRIVFQMEQTVSDRWFDERYLRILENSRAVLDYSLANLAYLSERKIAYPHVFHVPLGPIVDYAAIRGIVRNTDTAAQVLFYGDHNAPRRKQYLEALQSQYNVRIISNLFGADLQNAIANAQIVVNIHYYEGALLESTRIFECLSLGAKVVSESATDVGDYPGLETVVQFVPVGDIAAMVSAVGKALARPVVQEDSTDDTHREYLRAAQNRFAFMFYRAMLAHKLVSYKQFSELVKPPEATAFVLSLPETMERRAAYLANPAAGVQVFDGLRARPGWVGCALSYKYLCSSAFDRGLDQLLICEDDVELPANYDETLSTIREYLQANDGQWDIFVGIIAHLHPDTMVLDVEERSGLTFVTVDRMTSMVFNIYSRRAMELIANWDENLQGDQTNTIDRYLERTDNLRIVTLLEPVFGHREDLKSSLWGFGNDAYNDYIEKSRSQLRDKVAAFRARVTQ